MLDPRGIEGVVDSTEEEVAMDTSSVQSEGSEREPAVQPQVGHSKLLAFLIFDTATEVTGLYLIESAVT